MLRKIQTRLFNYNLFSKFYNEHLNQLTSNPLN